MKIQNSRTHIAINSRRGVNMSPKRILTSKVSNTTKNEMEIKNILDMQKSMTREI